MPASIRVIAIIKDAMGGEMYTVEFECESEKAEDLIKELVKSPYGQRAIELLNDANFLPERPAKTQEELKVEAEEEQKDREIHEESLREHGRREVLLKVMAKLRRIRGDEFVKAFEEILSSDEEGEELTKKFEEALAKNSKEEEAISSNQETNQETSSNQAITTSYGEENREQE